MELYSCIRVIKEKPDGLRSILKGCIYAPYADKMQYLIYKDERITDIFTLKGRRAATYKCKKDWLTINPHECCVPQQHPINPAMVVYWPGRINSAASMETQSKHCCLSLLLQKPNSAVTLSLYVNFLNAVRQLAP